MAGTEFEKAGIVSSDQSRKCIVSSLLGSQKMKELLLISDILIALFPNLHKLSSISLSIPISTASAEQIFSGMKLIKNHLCNRLTELSLSNLVKIVIESPEELMIVIWKKLLTFGIEKVDGLLCNLSFRLLSHYICILSLLMHCVKHLSTSIRILMIQFPRGVAQGFQGIGVPRGCNHPPPPPPPP